MSTYNLHYNNCRSNYKENGPSVYNLTVDTNLITTNKFIPIIADKVKNKIDNMEGCFEDDHAYRLNEWHDIEEIGHYADKVMPLIEKEIFSSHLKVEFVQPYRNKIGGKEATSWLWHYDDCPQEFIKLFLYLNEVTPTSGCLEYLDKKIHTNRVSPFYNVGGQVYPRSRVPPAEIRKFLDDGLEINQLVGPPGTAAVFTPNIVHRATIPEEGSTERDAIVFFLRPSLAKQNKYITEDTYSYLPERNVKQYELN
tara:strand:+ start:62 stop:820 length:759 start_codon:yes stop_codon:yes gene_type:complete